MRELLTDLIHRIRDDRRTLERTIFPYLVKRPEFSKILFVGCQWYTRRYNVIFQEKDYWTLEYVPGRRKYGARNHITASVEDVHRHFGENELDVIICNGVFGWGLDARSTVERAFERCFGCLREGGILVLGWNDIARRRPFALDDCQSLRLFDPFVFPPLLTTEYATNTRNRHIYSFFIKPGKVAT